MFNRRLQQAQEEQLRQQRLQAEAQGRQQQAQAQAAADKAHRRQLHFDAIAQQDPRYNQVLTFLNDEFRPAMDEVFALHKEFQRQKARTTWKEAQPRVPSSYTLVIEPVVYGEDFRYTGSTYGDDNDALTWWREFFPQDVAFKISAITNVELDITSLATPESKHKGAGYTMFVSLNGQAATEHLWYMAEFGYGSGKRKVFTWKVDHKNLESLIDALVESAVWLKTEIADLKIKPDWKPRAQS